MSTAEQIIAEHRVSYTFDGEGSCTCGEKVSQPDHAAHVVAALTNAGHIEMEYSVERELIDGSREVVNRTWTRAEVEAMALRGTDGVVAVQRWVVYGEWEPAAARVAEGGERC